MQLRPHKCRGSSGAGSKGLGGLLHNARSVHRVVVKLLDPWKPANELLNESVCRGCRVVRHLAMYMRRMMSSSVRGVATVVSALVLMWLTTAVPLWK